MLISPKTAFESGWIKHSKYATYEEWEAASLIGPNAIDFTIDDLFSISEDKPFIISEESKTMRGGDKVLPVEGYWELNGHTAYDGLSSIYVDLPEGIACELIIRSTFNRNGVFLTSGLYDSGYKGSIGFGIHNRSGKAFIAPGTRIGQIKFVSSDKGGLYKGGWNHAEGEHWSKSTNGESE